MEAVVALSGHGGWPMTVFLTPDGRPFWGGTYFPPEPRMGMPSFRQVLVAMADVYRERRGDLERQADQLVDAIRAASDRRASPEPLTSGLLSSALSTLRNQFDSAHGGFGGAPKFPPSATLELLLRLHAAHGAPGALDMARLTLDRMAAGGMYDQLGGGFHRYAVDTIWLVPHFEKMLYDNALLASAYLHAWAIEGEARDRRVVEETLDYLVRVLRLPEGGFASAEDADTEGVEGLTYTWTPEEIRELVGSESAERIERRYGVEEGGNFEGRSILFLADPDVDDADARAVLLEARDRRPQPLRDDKALAGWNGLALAAFAEAGRRLERPDYVRVGRELAEFILGPLSREDGRLWRTFRAGQAKIPAYLEDYADVAHGLLELYWTTGELRFYEEADRLARLAVELFGDEERGGFYVDAPEGEGLVARRKELDDHPVPSGNSMLAFVLLRLARISGDAELERRAVSVFRLAYPLFERAPHAIGWMLAALDLHLAAPREIAVVGESAELRRAALEPFAPTAVFAFAEGAEDPALERIPLLAGKAPVNGEAAAYVCESFACQAPTTDPAALRAALAG
jgi:uncharacterized protein